MALYQTHKTTADRMAGSSLMGAHRTLTDVGSGIIAKPNSRSKGCSQCKHSCTFQQPSRDVVSAPVDNILGLLQCMGAHSQMNENHKNLGVQCGSQAIQTVD